MSTDAPALDLRSPWQNAAGSLGFAPEKANADLNALGAFVTNPLTLRPRRASQGERMLKFPGGVLMHTGLPNPGLSAAVKRYAAAWARAPLPIILHIAADDPAALRKSMPNIEALENITAIELGIPADAAPQLAAGLVQAAAGELPVIAQLSLLRSEELAAEALRAGASAISLGPPRGALTGSKGKLVEGRLYGPAIYPLALAVVQRLAKAQVPVVGSGGIETEEQGETMLKAGALAVQVDVAFWKGWTKA
jgi:dihydroorotate dehydrogenase (NAD+) catalytic subunit